MRNETLERDAFMSGFLDELEKDADFKQRVLGWIGKSPTQPSPVAPLQAALASRKSQVAARVEGIKPVITHRQPMRGPTEDFPLFGDSGRRDLKVLVRKRALGAPASPSLT